MRRILSLPALRAFEAALRHRSFTQAAAELAVTPAAVSHQVLELEAAVGRKLFERLPRRLEPTDRAREVTADLSAAFDLLDRVSRRLREAARAASLRLSVEPFFAAKWLVPRLSGFRIGHPDIDLWLDASTRPVDLGREAVDGAIRHARAAPSGLAADRLIDDVLVPVCSPRLLVDHAPVAGVEDLARLPLVHIEESPDDDGWAALFKRAGMPHVDTSRGPRFNLDSMAVQAAIEGQGVVLASEALVTDDLAAGRLVRPVATTLPSGAAYWLLALPERVRDGAFASFRAWLLADLRGAT